jgi:hypothetical protein
MTNKKFLNALANGKVDVIKEFLDLISELNIDYCMIGGLAVNAYAEPVVSMDLDLVLTLADRDKMIEAAKSKFKVENYSHSINLTHPQSDLRIQIQTEPRYQYFIANAVMKQVLGYDLRVAKLEDVLQGKLWAYQDEERRKSKRQKDLADIMRLVETHQHLYDLLPEKVKAML